jgi:cytidine deaminase
MEEIPRVCEISFCKYSGESELSEEPMKQPQVPETYPLSLPHGWEVGFTLAKEARSRAYAPYSQFYVGFALHHQGTDLFTPGANIENASYGATICAERSAVVSAMGSRGKESYDYGVLVTDAEPPAVPCAMCLQVLAEICGADFLVIVCNMQGPVKTLTISELLPYSFTEIPPQGT